MDGADTEAALALLRRGPVLAACRDGPTTRRGIAERTGVSRTTAYRATTDLVARGLLAKRQGGYLATEQGRALLAANDDFRTRIATIESLDELFERVDHPDLIENAHRLGDATVIVADASNPYRIVDRSVERLEATTRSVGTLVNPTAVEAIRRSEGIVPGMDHFERILTEPALDAHRNVGTGAFDAVEASIELLVAPADAVPFSFAIDDDDVSIVGHDPGTGLPTAHVESPDPAAREWLEDRYQRCRERARPLDP